MSETNWCVTLPDSVRRKFTGTEKQVIEHCEQNLRKLVGSTNIIFKWIAHYEDGVYLGQWGAMLNPNGTHITRKGKAMHAYYFDPSERATCKS